MTGIQASSQASAGKREATCNAILDATSELIAEKGVDGFTMSEVAERGNVNRALIYHYYHDRETLVFETIRFIVKRYDEISQGDVNNSVEREFRLHIDNPQIARFVFHLMLTGKQLPRLSTRLTDAAEELQKIKAAFAPQSAFDPTFAVITGWLAELAWSACREEIARLLGLTLEEADRRFLAHILKSAERIRAQIQPPA